MTAGCLGGVFRHAGQFAHGETVHVGDAEGADVAEEIGVHGRAVGLEAAQRIGAIEDNDFDAVFKAGGHGALHGADKRVAACADVLQIDDECVEVLELGLGRLASLAVVERADGEAGAFVAVVVEVFPSGKFAVDAVFDGEKGDEFDAGSAAEDVGGGNAAAIDTRRMREEAEAFAFHGGETVGLQDVDAEEERAGFFCRPRRGCYRDLRGDERSGGLRSRRLARAATEETEQRHEQREQRLEERETERAEHKGG